MKKHLLFLILCLMGILTSCSQKHTRYYIGVSQCSDDEWRHKMNHEIVREALFYDGVEVEIRTAKDNSRNQIEDINYFIDRKVDLLIVAPNEAAAVTPVVEKAYGLGIPVVVIDRKILSDRYTAFVGADNCEIGKDVGQYIVNRLGGKGKILEITGLEGSTPAMERHRGLADALKAEPGIEIAASVDGAWLQSVAGEKMDSILQDNKDINLVFAQNDRMAVGAYLSARQRQLEKEMLFVGIDALPGKGYGVEQVLEGVLDATFIYPTGGDKVMQVAMDILEKRPYERDTKLSTALVDKTNARVMQLQTDHIAEQDGKIERLNNQVDEYWSRYSAQTMFLYACLIILLLFAALLAIIVRAYWTKNRMNMELSRQKKQLEEQRDQLISLSKQLEEATHAKLVFFTNVSHDFRTPLTLVADPVEQLLEDKDLTSKQRSLLKVVHKNVNILLRLVNQILDFRKYENGKLELVRTNMDLRAQLQEWSHAFQTLALRKHIHFVLDVNDDRTDCLMALDAEKMERVYFNLLSNAFKYTPDEKSISLSVTCEKQILCLQVKDEGRGINAQKLNRLFTRFDTLDEIDPNMSTGIGLSLVKELLNLLHGTVRVDSKLGEGSSFFIRLPGNRDVFDADANIEFILADSKNSGQEVAIPDKLTEEEEDKETRILIIEDNEELRHFICGVLAREYVVLEAGNGCQGLEMTLRELPDIVISDIMMPEMDGIEYLKRVKGNNDICHIPIILLSAKSSLNDQIQGLEYGADEYITKPFSSAYLKARVDSLLKQRQILYDYYISKMREGEKDTSLMEQLTPSTPQVTHFDNDFIRNILQSVEENIQNSEFKIDDLAEAMSMSRTVFYRKVKSLMGVSPVDFVKTMRIKRAVQLLEQDEFTVSEVGYMSGFTTPQYFSRVFKEAMGCTPKEYRLKHKTIVEQNV